MAQGPTDPHICQMVKWPHAVLSAAAEYKIIGVLPALVKLVASVAQFAIALAVTIFLFFNSGAAHYIKHAAGEIGVSLTLLVTSVQDVTCGRTELLMADRKDTFKDRIISYMNG